VIMNVLLWRSEVSATRVEGSPVPVETVWERILTAPDDSTLEIHRRGHKIGWCRWVPKVEEGMPTTPAPGPGTGGELPEGQVTRVSGYSISLDGNVSLEDPAERVRFTGRVDFDVRREWQALFVRVTLRPNTFELRADAAQQTVSFRMGDQPGAWEQTFSFDQLAQPEAVLVAPRSAWA
jgi:hypothetical protein